MAKGSMSGRRKILCWMAGVFAGGVALLGLAFGVMIWLTNRPALPPELAQPPRALLAPPSEIKVGPKLPAGLAARPASIPNPQSGSRPRDYWPFLEETLRRDPSQEGIRLFLEIERHNDGGFTKSDPAVGQKNTGWQQVTVRPQPLSPRKNHWVPGEPLLPQMKSWLLEHQDRVELCVRFGEQARLPALPPGLVQFDFRYNYNFHYIMEILAAELARCRDEGNPARVRRIGRGLVNVISAFDRLARAFAEQSPDSYLAHLDYFYEGYGLNTLAAVVQCDSLTSEGLKTLRPMLAEVHRKVFLKEAKIDGYREEGLRLREQITEKLKAPWNSHYYLEQEWKIGAYRSDLSAGAIRLYDMPRPDRMAWDALRAMQEARAFKRVGPALLRQFDEYWPRLLEYGRPSYPVLMAQSPLNAPWKNSVSPLTKDILSAYGGQEVKESLIWIYRHEARLNLVRAAAEWRLDPRSAPGNAELDLSAERENPWRDPFTERPLHVEQTTTATLIYSLGPDQTDQHGRVPSEEVVIPPAKQLHMDRDKQPLFTQGDLALWLRR